MYNYTPIAKLEDSAIELNGLLKQTKKLKVEAKQQTTDDIGAFEYVP